MFLSNVIDYQILQNKNRVFLAQGYSSEQKKKKVNTCIYSDIFSEIWPDNVQKLAIISSSVNEFTAFFTMTLASYFLH